MTSPSDIRFAIRAMLKAPGLSAAGVIALAMGIGANTAIFSLADAMLIKPLSVPDDRGVYVMTETPPGKPDLPNTVAPANYLDWKTQNRSFEQMAAFEWWGMALTSGGYPENLLALRVSKEFFPLLRANAMLGRTFVPEEDEPGHERVILLSHRLWQTHFNADPHIIGREVELDLKKYTVVGVMPKAFAFPAGIDFWAPLALDTRQKHTRDNHSVFVMARLRPPVSPGEAQAEMWAITKRLDASYPDTNHGWGVMLMPIREFMIGKLTAQYLGMLLVAVGFVLLIACANVSNVLVARAMARQKELALRVALGAGRWRLVRQLLTESVVLSGVGMLVGLLIGYCEIRVLVNAMPATVARYIVNWQNVTLDWRALLFTTAVAMLCGVISGLVPALRSSRPDLNVTLKEGGRGSSQARSQHRMKSILLVGEIALSLMLLVGAGLMVRGVNALYGDTDAYAPERTLTFLIGLPDTRYTSSAQVGHFFERLLTSLGEIPDARNVSVASTLPYSNISNSRVFTIEGQVRERGAATGALIQTVNPEFFPLLHIPLRDGRLISAADGENTPKVVVISESIARRFWPGQNPLGRHLKLGGPDSQEPWLTVAGVAGDVRYRWFERSLPFTIYVPFAQSPQSFTYVVLHTSNPDRLVDTVRRKVAKLDPQLPLSNAMSYAELIRASLMGMSYLAVMMTVLGAMALVLACVGVYGVMAYSVTERTREIGIRMALGAKAGSVVGMMLRRGVVLTGVGLLIGLVGSVAQARLLASLIWGVSALDLGTFAGVSAALVCVALLASYVPARRAARVDPLISLRCE
jgi:putative ABC transport system permease protein